MATWVGVDVGGPRKGFDVAVIDDRSLLHLARRLQVAEVAAIVQSTASSLAAIDSPRCCAPVGATTRDGERSLARNVCGIRWTPDETKVKASGYYGWIVEGLKLYAALAAVAVETIEVFPTASWTRWHGPRGGRSRSAWSTAALAGLGLDNVPERTNQDQRDAIAAAATARAQTHRMTEAFGEIIVPALHGPLLPRTLRTREIPSVLAKLERNEAQLVVPAQSLVEPTRVVVEQRLSEL